MKKLLLLFALTLCMVACGGSDEPNTDTSDKQAINELATLLKGKFVASEYSSTFNTTETTEITFTPYSSPKAEEWGGGNLPSKTVTMYGECVVVKYYNDHLGETSTTWKYNIEVAYKGAQPKLNYYPDVYGRTETHTINKKSATSFELDGTLFNRQ